MSSPFYPADSDMHERPIKMGNPKPIVFISCGQHTEGEINLGTQIEALVRDLTPFDPYFAEMQTTVEGLTTHILGALNRCDGLIVVLHARGVVSPPGNLIRASVWVEQEVAIAAFLRQVLGRKIHVVAFAEKGIALEGMRAQLQLNPKPFEKNEEVLDRLRLVLPTWQTVAAVYPADGLDVEIAYEEVRIQSTRHDYRLLVFLSNRGTTPVNRYYVDLEFPSPLAVRPHDHSLYVQARSTRAISLFRVTDKQLDTVIYPGDTLRAMTLDYFVNDKIFFEKSHLLQEKVVATVYAEGMAPRTVEKPMAQLQVF